MMNTNEKNHLSYTMSKTIIVTLLTVITTVGITACGQKGALYLSTTGETIQSPSTQDNKNGFPASKILISETEQEIQQRIEKMKADPNDY